MTQCFRGPLQQRLAPYTLLLGTQTVEVPHRCHPSALPACRISFSRSERTERVCACLPEWSKLFLAWNSTHLLGLLAVVIFGGTRMTTTHQVCLYRPPFKIKTHFPASLFFPFAPPPAGLTHRQKHAYAHHVKLKSIRRGELTYRSMHLSSRPLVHTSLLW